MTLTYPMIDRIEGTFYLKDPETEEATYEIQFYVGDEHTEQWGATKNQLIQAETSELLIELQKLLVRFNHPEIYGKL
jgi:hypothetical protein